MHFYFRGFLHPDKPVLLKIVYLWRSVVKGKVAVHGMSDTVYNTAFHLVPGTGGIDHNTTIYNTGHFFNRRHSRIFIHTNVHNFGYMAVMAIVGGKAAVYTRRGRFVPARFCNCSTNDLLHTFRGILYSLVGSALYFLEQVQSDLNRIGSDDLKQFVQETLLGKSQKIGIRCAPWSRGDMAFV